MSVLEEILKSHRYALELAPDNADTLFNTAQVLNSVAEEIFKNESLSDGPAVGCLEEALELLQRCRSLQESSYVQSQELRAAAPEASARAAEETLSENDDYDDAGLERSRNESGGGNGGSDAEADQEQWALIVEPVTKDTLLDTVTAQLSTLTTLSGILGSSPEAAGGSIGLGWVEEYSSKIVSEEVGRWAEDTDRTVEVATAKAAFISAMLEAGFRQGRIDIQTYKQRRDSAFSKVSNSSSHAALAADAASLFAFNHALSESEADSVRSAEALSLRWSALSTVISKLAAGWKVLEKGPEERTKNQLLRGDGSLYQYQLSKPPFSYALALRSSAVLLANAETFYRNASRLTQDDGERDRSKVQEAILMSLQGKATGRAQLGTVAASRGSQWVREHIDQLVADGLVGDEDLRMIGLQ